MQNNSPRPPQRPQIQGRIVDLWPSDLWHDICSRDISSLLSGDFLRLDTALWKPLPMFQPTCQLPPPHQGLKMNHAGMFYVNAGVSRQEVTWDQEVWPFWQGYLTFNSVTRGIFYYDVILWFKTFHMYPLVGFILFKTLWGYKKSLSQGVMLKKSSGPTPLTWNCFFHV